MKYKFWSLLCLALALSIAALAPITAFADGSEAASAASEAEVVPSQPDITSGNAIVAYCLDDDQFLYTSRGDERVAPTVAAKLVTLMVVADVFAEKGIKPADEDVTVTTTAIDNSGDISDFRVPMMGFKAGSVYKARDLISATLVANANDACAALACHCGELLGGNIITFIQRMNKKAEELGLTNTYFVNPTGLDAPNQVTTPREAAMIAAAFYKYNDLVVLSDVESFHFNNASLVRNKNYLKSNYYIDGYLNKKAIGLIAGQKDRAGDYCLMTAAQKDGRTYIFVVMCATGVIVDADRRYALVDGNAYVDMNKLINWTLDAFVYTPVALSEYAIAELRVNAGNTTDHVLVGPAKDVEKLVLKSSVDNIGFRIEYDAEKVFKSTVNGVEADTVNAPVSKGMKVGTVTYFCEGTELATVDLITMKDVDSDAVKSMFSGIKDFLFGDVMKTVLIVLGVIIGAYIVIALTMAVVRASKRVSAAKKKSAKRAGKEAVPVKSGKNEKTPVGKNGSGNDDLNHTIQA